jgi:hypothetical protein
MGIPLLRDTPVSCLVFQPLRGTPFGHSGSVAGNTLADRLFRQPEIAREDTGLSQAIVWAEVDEVLARIEGRLVDRLGRPTSHRFLFRASPQGVHRVQLRRGPGQQANLDGQWGGVGEALRTLVLTGSILEEHEVPAAPVSADQGQERLMRLLGPFRGDQQGDITTLDVDRPVKDPLGPVARDRDPHLLADRAVTRVKGGRLRDDRLIEHEQHGPFVVLQAGFQPPFDCRHVGGRNAN